MTTLQTALATAATATASATLVAGKHTPVDAASGALTMTLPTPATIGARLRVEKLDASANTVTISGTIRGSAGTVALRWQYETLELVAESLTSWRPASDHKPKSGMDATYVPQTGVKRLLRVPTSPPTRSADQTVAANVGNAQLLTTPVSGKFRRAKVRITGGNTQIAVAAYPTDWSGPIPTPDDPLVGSAHNALCTSGAVNTLTSAGDLEIALPPTRIVGDFWGVVAAGAAGVTTLGGNGSSGYVMGAQTIPSAFPLSGALTGVAATDLLAAVVFLGDDPTPLSSTYSRATTVNGSGAQISVLGKIGSKLYGRNRNTDKWATSATPGTPSSWVDQTGPVFLTAFGAATIMQIIGHSTFMVLWTNDGRVFRAPLDDFSTFAEITPSGLPAGTTGRQDTLASDGTNLLYTNYNGSAQGAVGASVWRSTDNGATWTNVKSLPTARHGHGIYFDPVTPTWAWWTVGDDVAAAGGLYKSIDSGVTWTLWSSSKYGIGACFHTGVAGMVDRLILEGDGTRKGPIFSFPRTAAVGSVTDTLIYADTNPDDGYGTWGGTARASIITAGGNLVFASSAEGGTGNNAYRRDGLWAAKGPWFTTPVLLEEFTPSLPVAGDNRTLQTVPSWGKSFELGGRIYNSIYNFASPTFAGQ